MTSFTDMLLGTLYFGFALIMVRYFFFGIFEIIKNLTIFSGSNLTIIFTIIQYLGSLMILILVPIMYYRGGEVVDKVLKKV